MVRNEEFRMVSKNESSITLQHFDKNKTNLTEQNSSFNTQIGLVKTQTKSEFNSPPKTPVKRKKEKSGSRQGTAIFTSVPNNSKDAFKLPTQITVTYEEIEKNQKVDVKNINNDDLIDLNEHLCFNALGLIGKGREKEKKDDIVYFCNKNSKDKDKIDYYLNTDYTIYSSELLSFCDLLHKR